MAANRWNLITLSVGGAVLLLMLLAAAFSLGVYIGEHGLTRDGLSYAGPNAGNKGGAVNQPGQGGLPQDGQLPDRTPQVPQVPAGLPSGRPNLTGRILRIQPQSLQVATPDGPRLIILTNETRFLEQDGSVLTLKDLQQGDVVAVFGIFIGGDGGELRADFIVRLPPKE